MKPEELIREEEEERKGRCAAFLCPSFEISRGGVFVPVPVSHELDAPHFRGHLPNLLAPLFFPLVFLSLYISFLFKQKHKEPHSR